MNNIPTMRTVSAAAAETGLPAYRLRCWVLGGQVAGVRCGRKLLVNIDSLAAFLSAGDAAQADITFGIRRQY